MHKKKELGLAVDIGTTTITIALINLNAKKELLRLSGPNYQYEFGDDIISRIDFVLRKKQNLNTLKNKAVYSINKLIKQSKIDKNNIINVALVGNSAMNHLFLGINPRPLITPPYRPAIKDTVYKKAQDTGLLVNRNAQVVFLPNIAGFVGSDTLGLIISSEIHNSAQIKLGIDIGTNGEIVLGNKNKILVTSTAAGPVFEAKYIKCATRPQKGAIDSIKIASGKIKYSVIGNIKPKGICGSGLIDLVSQLLKENIIDKSGRFIHCKRFVIYKTQNREIFIDQQDIRKFQLAKAAIRAGIETLINSCKIGYKDISGVLITGRFGNRLNRQNIINIGLVPPAKNVFFLFDAALEGAKQYLLDPQKQKQEISRILEKTVHIRLISKTFQERFVENISF